MLAQTSIPFTLETEAAAHIINMPPTPHCHHTFKTTLNSDTPHVQRMQVAVCKQCCVVTAVQCGLVHLKAKLLSHGLVALPLRLSLLHVNMHIESVIRQHLLCIQTVCQSFVCLCNLIRRLTHYISLFACVLAQVVELHQEATLATATATTAVQKHFSCMRT